MLREVFQGNGYTLSDQFGYPLSNSHPFSVGILECQPIDKTSFWERNFGIPKEYQLGILHMHSEHYGAEIGSKWVLECFGYSRQKDLYSLAENLENKMSISVVPVIKNREIRTEPVDPCDLI